MYNRLHANSRQTYHLNIDGRNKTSDSWCTRRLQQPIFFTAEGTEGWGLGVLFVVFGGFLVCGRFCGVGGDEKYYRQGMGIIKK